MFLIYNDEILFTAKTTRTRYIIKRINDLAVHFYGVFFASGLLDGFVLIEEFKTFEHSTGRIHSLKPKY